MYGYVYSHNPKPAWDLPVHEARAWLVRHAFMSKTEAPQACLELRTGELSCLQMLPGRRV